MTRSDEAATGLAQRVMGQGARGVSGEGRDTGQELRGPQNGLQRVVVVATPGAEREQRALENFERVLSSDADVLWKEAIRLQVRKLMDVRG